MSNVAIRKALQAHLLAMPGGLGAAFTQLDNTIFDPAEKCPNGEPYQRANLLPAATENPAIGPKFRRYRGVFQITLAYPVGKGSGPADAMAEAIAARFARGLSVTANQVTTTIGRTPVIKSGRVAGDRWEIPIDVGYYADVGV